MQLLLSGFKRKSKTVLETLCFGILLHKISYHFQIRETFATTSFMRNSGGEVDGVEVTGFIRGSIIVHYLVTVSVPDIGVTDDGIRVRKTFDFGFNYVAQM